MAVEDKQGISRLEQVVEEISEAERAKELKKEHKRLKRKKRKENSKCKFANENEKKEIILTNGEEDACNGKENESANIQCSEEQLSVKTCNEEKSRNLEIESEANGAHESSDESSCPSENSKIIDTHSCNEEVSSNGEKCFKGSSSEQENCKCGDEKKGKLHRKNGFINVPEEEASQSKPGVAKKQKGVQPNGFITPPRCSSCGQSVSPRGKFDRGGSDRGKESSQYTEICVKCASLNSDGGGGKRNRKKFGRQREVRDHCFYYVICMCSVFVASIRICEFQILATVGNNSDIVRPPIGRGGLALLFWGGVMALKRPVGRCQALNGCSHLEQISNYNKAWVAIAT